jgi:hypothetical protein
MPRDIAGSPEADDISLDPLLEARPWLVIDQPPLISTPPHEDTKSRREKRAVKSFDMVETT